MQSSPTRMLAVEALIGFGGFAGLLLLAYLCIAPLASFDAAASLRAAAARRTTHAQSSPAASGTAAGRLRRGQGSRSLTFPTGSASLDESSRDVLDDIVPASDSDDSDSLLIRPAREADGDLPPIVTVGAWRNRRMLPYVAGRGIPAAWPIPRTSPELPAPRSIIGFLGISRGRP